MPVKNAPTATWYRIPSSHPRASSPRPPHSPKAPQPSQQPRPVHPQHPVMRPGSQPPSQIPGSRSPSLSGRASPLLLPSKLPTSASGCSSASASPRRTAPTSPSKIASPTRLRNADRLPPVSRAAAATAAVEQSAVSALRKLTGLRAKSKDGKVAKEKTNENRVRGGGQDAGAKKDLVKKEKTDGERNRENEAIKKKCADARADSKGIPKRKKSERSNSETEIKPKKMIIKEHLTISRVDESQERNGSARLSKVRPQDRGSRVTKDLRRPTTLRLSQVSRVDSVRSVEKQLKEMDLGKDAEGKTGANEAESRGSVKSGELTSSEGGSILDNKETEARPMECAVECQRLGKCEGREGGDEIDGKCIVREAAKVVYPGDNVQDDGDELREDDGLDTAAYSVVADVAEGGGVGDEVVEHVINCKAEEGSALDDSHVMKDESDMDDNHVMKDDCALDDSHVMKEESVMDDSHVMKDDCALDDNHVMKDESVINVINDNHVIKDDCALDDIHVMKVESVLDDSHVMKDESVINDNHVIKGDCSLDDSHVMKDESVMNDSRSTRVESAINKIHSVKDEEGTNTEEMPIDSDPALDGTRDENKNSEEITRDVEQLLMNEEMGIVVAEEGDRNQHQCLEQKCKTVEELIVRHDLEALPVLPEVNGNDNIYLEGEMGQAVRVNSDKKQTEEEKLTRVNERRIKRKMDAERTRSGTNKTARLFVDRGSTASGGGGSRDSRVLSTNRANITAGEKKRPEPSAPPRRPRLDNVKSTIPKPGRLPPRKLTDPVKAARPVGPPTGGPRGPLAGHNGPGQQHPPPHADQLRRLEAEVAARAAELKAARAERDQFGRGVEALTILIHHLTNTYDPFTTPRLKAEVVRLNTLLTETRLSLDESSAAVRRLQEAEATSLEQHKQKVQQLEEQHHQVLEQLNKQHQHEMDLAFEKHRKEMSQFAEDQEAQREALSRAHSAEVEQLEGEWRNKLDVQHEKHLCAVQELNTQHTHKLRELESSRRARERELEEANFRLLQDQEALKIQSKKLEETLLNDTDHRLQAVRKMCSSLKSEVDSLKTVVEMKNAEIHDLRGQVVEMDRLSSELEAARDRAKALQAKTEDLQAQMEKKALQERHLVNEHRLLVETYQKESNAKKRLSLENEELAWKLRQREEIMSTSMPSSTLDLVSRSPATPRRQEGAPSPQAAPRSPRVTVRSPSGKISPSKCDINKRRSRLGLPPEDGVDGDSRVQEVSFESPPPSPCVKAVVEKSNSVSFILDLNDSQSDDSFLDLPPSPRPRPQRTVSLSAADRPRTPTHVRRVIHNNRANSLNRNGLHVDVKPKNINGKTKEVNGKAKELNEKPKEINGKSLDASSQGSRPGSRRTTSESSEGGSEMERVSPTGLAWTVPVHQPKSPVKINASRQNGSPVRSRIEHHLLEDPDEDEYEETPGSTHHFVEVVELSGVGLTSSSEAASDSELSQCDLKGGSSTDSDSDSSDGERHAKQDSSNGKPLGRKNGPWCPKEGAGEAMITDELLKQYTGDPDELLKQYTSDALTVEPLPNRGKRHPRRRLPSAPSSDSDDNNINPHNDGNNMDVSWSEDVDITSSSEMHEL